MSSASTSLQNDSQYTVISRKQPSSATSHSSRITDKFSLSPDPKTWGVDLDDREQDHGRDYDEREGLFSTRALSNVGCLLVLIVAVLALFVGYPIYTYVNGKMISRGYSSQSGRNASGQFPEIPGKRGLIDADTPADAYTFTSIHHNTTQLQLVFSDEFDQDGRTFYPGDDPYWEAVDLHYWGTNNMEWYDPEGLTTENGSLKITLSAKPNHDLDYTSGMMSTWNKFCFTGGLVVANIMLPGRSDITGLWPGVWSMGNLAENWIFLKEGQDMVQLTTEWCTCPGEPHPGPIHSDGSYVGRSAPEIDMIEAQVGSNFRLPGSSTLVGEVSQSGQWAPFNYKYEWFDTAENFIINNPDTTVLNSYKGGALQQATSCISKTNQACYSNMPNPCFTLYGFEYKPGFDDAYITWLNDGKQVCTVMASGLTADSRVEIASRPVSQEPMYIIANLGMSTNFGDVDLENLVFPANMYVDYIRVYQHPDHINIGCDPEEFPTKAYIEEYIEAYTQPNLTTWEEYGKPWPKNRLVDQC
ncbi:hypothetical protein V5O48_012732 [Marasmius crinis-equi]|uniref:GH16 domain-containing protein n=1 Tax=Marasmius crinis-equi TaxID=585013 RepID=A0ABR3F294_9AGAR